MTKLTKWHVRPAKTQISLGIRPVWSESSLSAWRKLGSLATHWAHSEDSDQTGRMPRLIWVFAGRTVNFVGFVMRRLNSHCVYCCQHVTFVVITTMQILSVFVGKRIWTGPAQRKVYAGFLIFRHKPHFNIYNVSRYVLLFKIAYCFPA